MSIIGSELLFGSADEGGYQIERSLRFNSSDSAYLSKTFASAGNRQKFTLSWWIKRCNPSSSNKRIFGYSTGANQFSVMHDSTGAFYFYADVTSPTDTVELTSSAKYRDSSAWYHFVMAIDTTQATDSNRVKVWVNGTQITAWATTNWPSQNGQFYWNASGINLRIGGITSYYIDAYLAEVYSIDGQALDPTSFGEFDTNGVWQPKAYTGTYGTNGFHLPFSDNSTAAALGTDTSGNGNDWTVNNISVQEFVNYSSNVTYDGSPDTVYTTGLVSAMFDGNTATAFGVNDGATNRYINIDLSGKGVSVSSTFRVYAAFRNGMVWKINGTTVSSSGVTHPNTGWQTLSGWSSGSVTSLYVQTPLGNACEVHAVEIDGVVLTNNLTAGNDSLVDTPTSYGTDTGAGGEVRGNYATFNPLSPVNSTLTNGNLDVSIGSNGRANSTFSASSGKWYFEAIFTSQPSVPTYGLVGIGDISSTSEMGTTSTSWGYRDDGNKMNSNSAVSYGATYAVGDVIGVAWDADTGNLTFYKNGTSQGTAYTNVLGAYGPVAGRNGGNSPAYSFNFGQRPFAYAAPSGFKALCTTNLPTPTLADGSTVMDVSLWSGNSANRTISGLNFEPDLIWVKCRSAAKNNSLMDSVRGFGTAKRLSSNLTTNEGNQTNLPDWAGYISGTTSDGYSITKSGTGANDWDNYNQSGLTYVGWAWDAGSSTVTNTDGSITSQVRANPSAGFSIVTYTGTLTSSPGTAPTVGHGLGVKPALIISKSRNPNGDDGGGWYVNHNYNYDNYLRLNTTGSQLGISANGGGTTANPTASVFSTYFIVGSNCNNNNYVAYCFAPVAGYSSMGSYVGNGSADGPFVYTGFRPAFVLLKTSSASGNDWFIYDYKREAEYNPSTKPLYPNGSFAEQADSRPFDLLSNGFKVRNNLYINASGATVIYAAWAQNPFQYARAR